jgi:hypothetical protein
MASDDAIDIDDYIKTLKQRIRIYEKDLDYSPTIDITVSRLAECRFLLRLCEAAKAWADDSTTDFEGRAEQYRRLYRAIRGEADAHE